jgi:pimeloyl-ACP methyl ester carboxylesterase
MNNTSLLPFQGHYFQRNGLLQHYLDEGTGAPVVMVHGNPTWCIYYRNLVDALRPTHRCIVPDHIGCGFSDKPGDDRYRYTLAQRVDDLEALLDHLEIRENITLVVHDWGGMIGMAYATRHPKRIARLVILNTAAFRLPKSKRLPLSLRIIRNTPLGPLLVRGLNSFARGAAWVGCKRQRMSPALRDQYCAPYNAWDSRIATLRFVQDIPLSPKDPAFAVVAETEENLGLLARVPMLICWGMKDFVFDKHFLAEWERRFPHAAVHRFEDCGHYILEDAEEIVPLVRTFLSTP